VLPNGCTNAGLRNLLKQKAVHCTHVLDLPPENHKGRQPGPRAKEKESLASHVIDDLVLGKTLVWVEGDILVIEDREAWAATAT